MMMRSRHLSSFQYLSRMPNQRNIQDTNHVCIHCKRHTIYFPDLFLEFFLQYHSLHDIGKIWIWILEFED
eukprot:06831.XXX_208640_208849_1 [CDS] Oithona nana genome sequencing.